MVASRLYYARHQFGDYGQADWWGRWHVGEIGMWQQMEWEQMGM